MITQTRILLVDDDEDFRWATGNVLKAVGYGVIQASDGQEALSLVEREIPDLVLMDYRMSGMNGLAVAAEMKRIIPAVPVVLITAYGEVDSAVKAMKLGVYDYVTKPVDNNDLLFTIKRALETGGLMQEMAYLRRVLSERATLLKQMGTSDPVRKLLERAEKVAPTTFTVLIEGESGTGKELIARYIHDLSRARKGPFVGLDCGAIPETLVESELFGSNKGAFTGADRDRPGHFEMAHEGTLFLDEIGNLSYATQQKLLRALQERMIWRLGSKKPVPVSVRIIAATNQYFAVDLKKGRFRQDLYFRLNEFFLKMPSLKERAEDIPYLAKRFLDEAERDLKKKCAGFSKEGLLALVAYPWPGNVRELKNVIRQAALLSEEESAIKDSHLRFTSRHPAPEGSQVRSHSAMGKGSLREIVNEQVNAAEIEIITEVLRKSGGNKSAAARTLKIDYKTLLRKIKTHGLT